MFNVPNKYRHRTGKLASDDSYGNNGMFNIPHYKISHYQFIVQASDGSGWEHASVSLLKEETTIVKQSKGNHVKRSQFVIVERCPTWEEMCYIKDLFWQETDMVMQYHPAKEDYISMHPYCLHLWRPTDQTVPKPPSIFVGINQQQPA